MLLTDVGQVLVMEVRQGLCLLTRAIENVCRQSDKVAIKRRLAVSVLSSLGSRWLVPRLYRFQNHHPEVDIAIHTTSTLATLDRRDGTDIAIRYGAGQWQGLKSVPLVKSFIFPVCSPDFLLHTRIEQPEDLIKAPLLRNPRQKWQSWFLAAGLDVSEPAYGSVYDDAGLLLQAAISGQGIALARDILAADDIKSGRLVRLFNINVEEEADFGWFLVWREPLKCNRADFEAFRTWLEHEMSLSAKSPQV